MMISVVGMFLLALGTGFTIVGAGNGAALVVGSGAGTILIGLILLRRMAGSIIGWLNTNDL